MTPETRAPCDRCAVTRRRRTGHMQRASWVSTLCTPHAELPRSSSHAFSRLPLSEATFGVSEGHLAAGDHEAHSTSARSRASTWCACAEPFANCTSEHQVRSSQVTDVESRRAESNPSSSMRLGEDDWVDLALRRRSEHEQTGPERVARINVTTRIGDRVAHARRRVGGRYHPEASRVIERRDG